MTRKIRLESNKAWWALKNLTFNFLQGFLGADCLSGLSCDMTYLQLLETFSVILMCSYQISLRRKAFL
jgi:hypothetical protein